MVREEREALNCGSVTSSLRVISDNDNCTRYSCRGTSICPDNRADTGHRPRGEESSPPPSPPPSLLRAGKRCIRRDIKSNIKYPPSARLISRLILSRTKKKLRSTQEILSFVPTYFIRVVNYIHIAGSFRGYPAIRVQVKEIEPIQLFLPTNISRLSKFLDAIVN